MEYLTLSLNFIIYVTIPSDILHDFKRIVSFECYIRTF